MALALLLAGAPQGNTLVEGDVVPDLRGLADDHAHAVVDEDPLTDLRPGMDLDPREQAAHVGYDAGDDRDAVLPQPVGDVVQPQGVQPRVGQDDLQGAAGGRVAVPYGLDILLHTLQQNNSFTLRTMPIISESKEYF